MKAWLDFAAAAFADVDDAQRGWQTPRSGADQVVTMVALWMTLSALSVSSSVTLARADQCGRYLAQTVRAGARWHGCGRWSWYFGCQGQAALSRRPEQHVGTRFNRRKMCSCRRQLAMVLLVRRPARRGCRAVLAASVLGRSGRTIKVPAWFPAGGRS
jgi:hypothetical protein